MRYAVEMESSNTTPEGSPHAVAVSAAGPRTLAIDIGGTGLKLLILDHSGQPLTERLRVETPRPATPDAVLAELTVLIGQAGHFDRVSVGFPGVVKAGIVHTAPNLDPSFAEYPLSAELERRTGKPVRVLNDAGVQGHGVISGRGTELVITLGTGMGCALFVDGRYVPNLELAHHPFKKGRTYEQYVGGAALEEVGKKKWRQRVLRVLQQIQPIFNPDHIYIGGGNVKHWKGALPANVTLVENTAGLLGGIKLWT